MSDEEELVDAGDDEKPGDDEKRVDMTTGAVTPKLFSLSWPLVLGNLLQTFYNLADMFWLGRYSAEAVAAVALMFPTAWMFISVAMGLTAAANAIVSQHIGAGNERAAQNVVAQTVILALVIASLLALIGFLIRHPLVALIGAEGAVYDAAIAYLEIILITIPFTFLFFVFRAVLRAAGDTKTAMWLMVISAGINVVIDPVFILDWGPFLGLGAQGAAIATLISRIFAAAVGLYILLHGGWGIKMRVGDMRPDYDVLRQLIAVGYPSSLDGLVRSFAAVAFAALVARFAASAIAAYGIGIRLMSVTWTVSGAIGQGAATGVGQNLGARQPGRASEVVWKGTAGTMALLFAFGGLVFLFPETFMRIFIADPEVVAEGVVLLQITAPVWAFFGGLMVIQGGFRGAGATKTAFVLSLLSRWLFRIPLAYWLAFTPPLTPVSVTGLWTGWAVAAVLAFVVGALWFTRGTWQDAIVDEGEEPRPDAGAGAEDVGDEATTD